MSPASYLRKLSLHIRGETPSRQEYAELTKAIEKDQTEDFFRRRIEAYLTSDQHIDKMTFRLEELFSMRASPVPFYSPLVSVLEDGARRIPAYPVNNSLNELFRQIAARNLTWDTLLTGKQYKVFPYKSDFILGGYDTPDAHFFSGAAGIPKSLAAPIHIKFAEDDARIAGVLSTGRFFGRNVNTALNKNRRRAAAIFRTFLCDDMKAVIVDEKGNQNGILDKVFPDALGGGHGQSQGQRGLTDDLHGSDPACLKCHYKLDPMGRTFQESGMVLAPLASPGALVYTTEAGKKVNIAVAGLGDLGHAITQQDEFVRCQVTHFWRWFVGEDIPLSEPMLVELSSKFNQVRRKPNDFIAYLVSRPEFGFAQGEDSNAQVIARAKNVLQNCNGCHALELVPSFTKWPIGGTEASHQRFLGGIRRSLSLDGSNRPRSMPPKSSSWQPSPDDLAALQKWFDLGAPNE